MTFLKAGDPTYGSGLIFWGKDSNEFYCLLINANGWFAVQRLVANRYLLPVAWRADPTRLRKGKASITRSRW